MFRRDKDHTSQIAAYFRDLLLVRPSLAGLHRIIAHTQEWPLSDRRYSQMLYALAIGSVLPDDERFLGIYNSDFRSIKEESFAGLGNALQDEAEMFAQMVAVAVSVTGLQATSDTLLSVFIAGLESARSLAESDRT